jgi:peroxiredoxin
MRLARLLQIKAGMENSEAPRNEARRLLDELYKSAPADKRVEVDFARITFQMRAMRTANHADREQLLTMTRRFQAEHPDDRRLPRLLAEVAVLFDLEPETKRSLLTGAQAVAKDEELKHRLEDDLRRLDWLGKPIPLQCTTLGGKAIKLEESRGKVVLLVFFADWSPPSMEAIAKIQRAIEPIPKDRLQVLGISLDNKQEELATAISKSSISFPVGFDGRGWASPLVRSLGINILPTVWLIDQQGRLNSLNALDGTAEQIWKLIRKPPRAE